MKKTKEQISYNMRRVKNKDSEIELLLRKELWKRGFRYKKNAKDVFGHPDIVFLKKKVAIFCDSEFWHGYEWEIHKNDFRSHEDFWVAKIEKNIARDKEVTARLEAEGWKVIRFWGNEIKTNLEECIKKTEEAVKR